MARPPLFRFRLLARSRALALLFFLPLFFLARPLGAEPAGIRNVLVLHSYHPGLSWTDGIMAGIREAFADRPEVRLHVEYLDTKRYQSPEYLTKVLETSIAYKLRGQRFDLVLLSDNDAFNFVLAHRESLFAGVPIVFCGVNGFAPESLLPYRGITGVAEVPSISDTLETALRLHPGTREVVVVGSTVDATGAMNHLQVQRTVPAFQDRVGFRFWNDRSMEELLRDGTGLGRHTLVLLTSTVSEGGRVLDFAEASARLRRHLSVPLYGLWDFFLGEGIVGGRLISSQAQGRTAAGMALRILDREDPASLPVVRGDANEYLFDYRELLRFDIPLDRLPAESRIVHRPSPFLQVKKWHFWSGLATISALSFACLTLLLHLFHRRHSAAILQSSEERFRSIFENAGNGMVAVTPEGRFLQVNAAFCIFLGYAREEVLALDVLAITHPDDLLLTQRSFSEARAGVRQHFFYEKRFLHHNGHTVWGQVTTVWIGDGEGEPRYGIGLVQDITPRKQAESRLEERDGHIRYLTSHDPLTDLPNRVLLQDRLDQALAKALLSGRRVGLFFLDLDRFKKINESLGHACGDQVLAETARRLRSVLPKSDTVARFGGDEFIALVEEIEDLPKVTLIAQKLLGALERPLDLQGEQIFISASLGVAIFPGDAQDAQGLLKSAEAAMYRVKTEGKNDFRFFQPQMNQRSREMLILESALRQAVAEEQFVLHYQPQLDLTTGRVVGVEALLRWEHPVMGTIPPVELIPLAEETGLIIPIGRWVLETACRQVRQWQASHSPLLRLAVNVSPREFRQPEIVDQVAAILAKTGLDPSALELEITESMIISEMGEAVERMKALSGMGVRFAVDDFGTGYSSINRLQHFPLHTLKIDRTYVRNIVDNPKDAAIAASIISLAHNLELQVVAEGIETPAQNAFFRDRHCACGQGFLFCRPLPPDRVEEVLRRAPFQRMPVAAVGAAIA